MAAATVPNIAVHFKNILFATDFSDHSRQALPYVTSLARGFGSKVHLCHVVTPSQLMIAAPEAAPCLYEATYKRSTEEMADLRRLPDIRGLNLNTIVAGGTLEDELTKAITDNEVDLIVLGTHGRTGIRRLVLGSVAEAICRIATCPVLTVGPDVVFNEAQAFRRILIPTDFSEHSTEILPYVLDIAREFGSTITFLHVIPTDAAVNVNARLLAEDARRTLKKAFIGECGGFKPQFLIEFGDTTEAILRAATENKADLIAMGIKSTPMPGIHLRSGVAYRIMATAQCPVLTCR